MSLIHSFPRFGLGTLNFGKQVSERDAAKMIELCISKGIVYFDTANCYSNGSSEIMLGKLLQHQRQHVLIGTKVGVKVGLDSQSSGLSANTIVTQVEKSLQRLGTEYVDLYFFHQPDQATPMDESLRAMENLRTSGKVKAFGVSNFSATQIKEINTVLDGSCQLEISAVQVVYNLLTRGIESELISTCKESQIPIMVYNALAGGLLTGKHREESSPPATTRFGYSKVYKERYWNSQNFDAVRTLSSAAEVEGKSLLELALSWIQMRIPKACIILGASTPHQLIENINAAESSPITSKSLVEIDNAWQLCMKTSFSYFR